LLTSQRCLTGRQARSDDTVAAASTGRESQGVPEDHKQPDLLDAWHNRYRWVSAEQFGDAMGVRRRVHPVELTGPEGSADGPGGERAAVRARTVRDHESDPEFVG
jgi:hypothetical protein